MISVAEITTEAGFATLADEWGGLAAHCAGATVFSTFPWLHNWWRVYGDGRELRIVVARGDGGELVGAAALCARPRRLMGRTVGWALEPLGGGVSDYVGFLLAQGREDQVCVELMSAFKRYGHGWALELSEVPQTMAAAGAVESCARSLGYCVQREDASGCPYLALPESWDDCLAKLGARLRKHVPYYIRRLLEGDGCRLQLVATEQERAAAMEALARLHEMRWATKAGRGNWIDPRFAEFHDRVSRALLAEGRLRLFVLHHGAAPVAALYAFRYGDTYYYYQGGFDPAWGQRSVGTAMIGLAVKTAIEEGAREFDFMRGRSEYKERWTTAVRRNSRLEVWPNRWARAAWRSAALVRRLAAAARTRCAARTSPILCGRRREREV